MASNRRRTDRTAKKDASGLARPELSFSFLSLFLLRYLNLALVLGYLFVAGDVAHGLLPYSLVLALSGVYFIGITSIMLLSVLRPGFLHRDTTFWFDCLVLTLGIAHDPYASMPVQLLLLESLIDNGLRYGLETYRRGLLVSGMALATGLGLRTLTDIGLQVPGVCITLMASSLAFYIYLLLAQNERYKNRLIKLSWTDELTGLLNRRALYEKADLLCAKLSVQQSAVVMFADMDNLKDYNDRYGHAFGDRVIQSVGIAIGASLRDGDIAARYGGDEFVVLFNNINIMDARRIAGRLQQSVSELDLEHSGLKASMSLGLAEVRGPEADFDAQLQRADAALYRAKEKPGKGSIATALTAG